MEILTLELLQSITFTLVMTNNMTTCSCNIVLVYTWSSSKPRVNHYLYSTLSFQMVVPHGLSVEDLYFMWHIIHH
jgi:hypothetical protein